MPTFAFFGTGPLAEWTLGTLVDRGYTPAIVVTKPDAPQGRHLHMESPKIKHWCDEKGIPVIQPEKLSLLPSDSPLHTQDFDFFVVASYGKILPDSILSIPKKGVLNIHPSLLPKYRGPSPIESALLAGDQETGVSIMILDNEVDHGPILVQQTVPIEKEMTAGALEILCGTIGGELLAENIPKYFGGELTPKEQDHTKATFCQKIEKSMGEIKLSDDIEDVRRKFRALTPWPGLFFFTEYNGTTIRVKVHTLNLTKEAETVSQIIESVIPEGRHEMTFEDFERGRR